MLGKKRQSLLIRTPYSEQRSTDMGAITKLNSMTREQLLAFAHFAYTASPTLLETHLGRESFREQYPIQSSYMGPAIPTVEEEVLDGEDLQTSFDFDGTRESSPETV